MNPKRLRSAIALTGAAGLVALMLVSAADGGQRVQTIAGPSPAPSAPALGDSAVSGDNAPPSLPVVSGAAGNAVGGLQSGPRRQRAAPSTPVPQGIEAGGATHQAAAPSRTTSTQAPTAPSGLKAPLRTAGNRIVDANADPVVLRGVERVGLQEPGGWPAITDAEIAHAKAWGANVIRLPISEAYSNPQCAGQYRANYFDAVDAAVQSVTSRGMLALLELSYVTRVPCGTPARYRMADRPVSVPFWRTVAGRYGANPLVGFDLFNEPHDLTDDQWRNGGEVTDWDVSGPVKWTVAGMQELYNAVRSTGTANVITISGTGWSADPAPIVHGDPVTGTNIVYAMHAYTCQNPDTAANFCTSNPANKQARINPSWMSVGSRYPVMITEFGWPNPDEGAYNASVIQVAQAQNPPWGWIAFAWTGKPKDIFGLVADLATYSPTPAGAPVKAALGSPP